MIWVVYIQSLGAQARVGPRPIMSLAANATLGWYGNWSGNEIRYLFGYLIIRRLSATCRRLRCEDGEPGLNWVNLNLNWTIRLLNI